MRSRVEIHAALSSLSATNKEPRMRTQQPHSFTAQPISAKRIAVMRFLRVLRTTLLELQPVLTLQSAMAQDRSAA